MSSFFSFALFLSLECARELFLSPRKSDYKSCSLWLWCVHFDEHLTEEYCMLSFAIANTIDLFLSHIILFTSGSLYLVNNLLDFFFVFVAREHAKSIQQNYGEDLQNGVNCWRILVGWIYQTNPVSILGCIKWFMVSQ